MQTLIEKKNNSYLLTSLIDELSTDSFEIQIFCSDFNELIKNLAISLEQKYITINNESSK